MGNDSGSERAKEIASWLRALEPLRGSPGTIGIRGGLPKHDFPFTAFVGAGRFIDFLEQELSLHEGGHSRAQAHPAKPPRLHTAIPDQISANRDHPWYWPLSALCSLTIDGVKEERAVHVDLTTGTAWVYGANFRDEPLIVKRGRIEVTLPVFEKNVTAVGVVG